MAAEAVHVAEAARQAPVAHYHRHLVQRFRQRGPEVPVAIGAAQARARVALDGVVQVREFQRVAHEEDGRVVADQVPVAFFRVELQGKAADIAFRVRRAPFASHRGKAREHGSLLAHGAKDFRPRIARDVVRDGKRAMRAGTLGMHAALGDDFAVEVGQLFQEPHILQQGRAAWACRLDVLVVDDRRAKGGGQLFHWTLSYREVNGRAKAYPNTGWAERMRRSPWLVQSNKFLKSKFSVRFRGWHQPRRVRGRS